MGPCWQLLAAVTMDLVVGANMLGHHTQVCVRVGAAGQADDARVDSAPPTLGLPNRHPAHRARRPAFGTTLQGLWRRGPAQEVPPRSFAEGRVAQVPDAPLQPLGNAFSSRDWHGRVPGASTAEARLPARAVAMLQRVPRLIRRSKLSCEGGLDVRVGRVSPSAFGRRSADARSSRRPAAKRQGPLASRNPCYRKMTMGSDHGRMV